MPALRILIPSFVPFIVSKRMCDGISVLAEYLIAHLRLLFPGKLVANRTRRNEIRLITCHIQAAKHCQETSSDGVESCKSKNHENDDDVTFSRYGRNTPSDPTNLGGKAVAISIGDDHSCAILENRQLKCQGHNGFGQLSYGNTNNTNTPIQSYQIAIKAFKSIVNLVSGIFCYFYRSYLLVSLESQKLNQKDRFFIVIFFSLKSYLLFR